MVSGLYVNSGAIYGHDVGSKMLDGDKSKVRPIDETPDGGTKAGNSLLSFGRHVITKHLPTRMRWKDRRPMPDFHEGNILNVSERAKSLIERFEPGVHQFVPVDFFGGKDRFVEHRYFLFCGNRIDSLDHEKTTFVMKHYPSSSAWVTAADLKRWGEEHLIPSHINPDEKAKFVFNRAQIGDAHLWVDKYIDGNKWMSDDLVQAISDAGLIGVVLPTTPLETV